jgi:hypothetical protein
VSWYVTLRGQRPKLVTFDSFVIDPDFVRFDDDGGYPLLVVRREELILMERYIDPPF